MKTLRPFSTLKVGGPAERIVSLSKIDLATEKLPKPVRILGSGSNVLMDDRGLKGTVILARDDPQKDPKIIEETDQEVILQVSAGMFLPRLARWTAKRGFLGCEYMIGIPGTVGGALIQNAGANQQEFKDVLQTAKLLDLSTASLSELNKEDCGLEYRKSKIKHSNRLAIEVFLKLKKGDFKAAQKRIELNLSYRKKSTPYTKPSLGSIFTRLAEGENWLFPGKLIEEAELKGFRIGDAAVSDVHANYIVNEGRARFEDVIAVIHHVEKTVFEKCRKKLIREIDIWTDQ